jgi:vacuolar protein 8
MVLGGLLYADMCVNLSNAGYLNAKADELEKAILRVIGTPVANFGWVPDTTKPRPAGAAMQTLLASASLDSPIKSSPLSRVDQAAASSINAASRPLSSLSIQEVSRLLQSLNLGAYAQDLTNNAIDGHCLEACGSLEDLKEMGIAMKVKAMILFSYIEAARRVGGRKDVVYAEEQKSASANLNGSLQAVPADDLISPALVPADIPPLIDLLKSGTAEEKEKAAGELWSLAVHTENQKAIATAGGIQPLGKLLRDGTSWAKEYAAAALKILAADAENQQSIVVQEASRNSSGCCRRVEQGQKSVLLERWDASLRTRTIKKRSPQRERSRESFSCSNGNASAKENAGEALGYLSRDTEIKKSIATAGGVPPLIQLLRDGSADTKEIAAGVLRNLARNEENQSVITDAGGIPPLVQLLKDGTFGAKEQAVVVLRYLAAGAENKKTIAVAGGIPPLVQLLTEGSAAAKEQAAGVLGSLAVDADNQRAIAAAGGIPLLVRLLRDDSSKAKENTAQALWNLAVNAENQKIIAAAGGIPPLVQLIKDGSVEAKEHATVALKNLAVNSENKTSIAAAGGIPPLIHLLREGSAVAKIQAAVALNLLGVEA